MSKFRKAIIAASAAVLLSSGGAAAEKLNLGREATSAEVAAWDIDIRPDGAGLPEGSGTVIRGEEVYVEQCAYCHGDFGEGIDRWPVVSGGIDTLDTEDPVKTVGSYWPYLSTVWDYVYRAMPFVEARSLSADDVYALTAYILYLNDIVDDEEFELNKANFAEIRMPNEDNFFADDRAELEIPDLGGDPCMENCKETVEITKRAAIIDVTPEDDNNPSSSID